MYSYNILNDKRKIGLTIFLYICFDFSVPNFGDDVLWERIDNEGQLTGIINYLQIKSPTTFLTISSTNFAQHNFWSNVPINEPQSGRIQDYS